MSGFNYCIMAYGATGSGKTFSMLGPPGGDLAGGGEPSPGSPHGIMPRAIFDLFREVDRRKQEQAAAAGAGLGVEDAGEGPGIRVMCTYLEIFNNSVFDLLQPCKKSR